LELTDYASSLELYLDTLRKEKARATKAMAALRDTIRCLFDKLPLLLNSAEDPRNTLKSLYTMEELISAVLLMFVSDESPTRNRFNNKRSTEVAKNTFEALGIKIPHLDTAHRVIKLIPEEWFTELRRQIIGRLLQKKIFQKFRYLDKYHVIAIDATGVHSAKVEDGGVTKKKSKNGRESATRNVLEAKLLIGKGIAISIGSEWIRTEDGANKEDCELNAFKRLAANMKKQFPRLQIMIVVDGLYPSEPFFTLIKKYNWEATAVLKDKKLGLLWDSVEAIQEKQANGILPSHGFFDKTVEKGKQVNYDYEWISELSWQGHQLSWCECLVNRKDGMDSRFVYVSSLFLRPSNVAEFVAMGRSRWNIEDSFNRQKNRQKILKHKTARDFETLKKYHLIAQIADMIKQFYEQSADAQTLLERSKDTISSLWRLVNVYLSDSQTVALPPAKKSYKFSQETLS